MKHHQRQHWDRSRRGFLRTSAGAAALAGLGGLGLPRLGLAQDGPWSVRPESEVDRLNFVVWTYGDIYTLRLGPVEVIVLNHPRHAQHVLRDHVHNYSKGGPVWDSVRTLFGNGLVVSEGDL